MSGFADVLLHIILNWICLDSGVIEDITLGFR